MSLWWTFRSIRLTLNHRNVLLCLTFYILVTAMYFLMFRAVSKELLKRKHLVVKQVLEVENNVSKLRNVHTAEKANRKVGVFTFPGKKISFIDEKTVPNISHRVKKYYNKKNVNDELFEKETAEEANRKVGVFTIPGQKITFIDEKTKPNISHSVKKYYNKKNVNDELIEKETAEEPNRKVGVFTLPGQKITFIDEITVPNISNSVEKYYNKKNVNDELIEEETAEEPNRKVGVFTFPGQKITFIEEITVPNISNSVEKYDKINVKEELIEKETKMVEEVTDWKEKYRKEGPIRGENNIFFIETSCFNMTSSRHVTTREACAIESAAKTMPDHHVYLLHTCDVRTPSSHGGDYLRHLLLVYRNVRLVKLDVTRFIETTPLEEWWDNGGALRNSRYPIEHVTDVIRFVALWKYGGTYMDLDVVVMRSFNELHNFVGAEHFNVIGSSVINFGVDKTGKQVASKCLELLRSHYDPKSLAMTGPGLLTRLLLERCSVWKIMHMDEERCHGFTVLPPRAFYLIPLRYWRDRAANNSLTLSFPLSLLSNSLAVHVWNSYTKHVPIEVGSSATYGLLAKQHCPNVYSHCGRTF